MMFGFVLVERLVQAYQVIHTSRAKIIAGVVIWFWSVARLPRAVQILVMVVAKVIAGLSDRGGSLPFRKRASFL